MSKKINLTINELKALDMDHFICTSVGVMKYLTLTCHIRYVALGISVEGFTFWKFPENKDLKKALISYKEYKNNNK